VLGLGVLATAAAQTVAAADPEASTPPTMPAGHAMPGAERSSGKTAPPPATEQAVYISPARQQTIGVRTAAVEDRTLSSTIRTVGLLSYDETRVTQINPKIAGWVDQMFVDYVGKFVRRGAPLLTIYSPALVATQREYLLALDGARQTRGSGYR
jgi:hypothetical protein